MQIFSVVEEKQDRLESTIQQVELILDTLAEGVCGTDANGLITFVNPSAARLLGYRIDEMLGRPVDTVLVRKRGDRMLQRKDGSWFPVQYASTPLYRNGVRSGSVVTFLDTTERGAIDVERAQHAAETHARESLEALNAQKDEFVAAISHDLRNPLAAIKGLAQLMRRQLAEVGRVDSDAVLQRVAGIDEAASRMSAQLDELLDVSRLELGTSLELHVRPVDLVDLARSVVATHLEANHQRSITLDLTQATIMLTADPVRLRRVLDNLVSNAMKYTPPSGEVAVRLYSEQVDHGRWAVVEVIDDGIGIPDADLPHLFERFFRGSNIAADAQGIGLGLATVRQLVEAHGGTVTVSSREGCGSRFTVRLPIAHA